MTLKIDIKSYYLVKIDKILSILSFKANVSPYSNLFNLKILLMLIMLLLNDSTYRAIMANKNVA